MLKFLVIVYNATKGFDTMKIKLTEDDENVSPATTPTKKIKEDCGKTERSKRSANNSSGTLRRRRVWDGCRQNTSSLETARKDADEEKDKRHPCLRLNSELSSYKSTHYMELQLLERLNNTCTSLVSFLLCKHFEMLKGWYHIFLHDSIFMFCGDFRYSGLLILIHLDKKNTRNFFYAIK